MPGPQFQRLSSRPNRDSRVSPVPAGIRILLGGEAGERGETLATDANADVARLQSWRESTTTTPTNTMEAGLRIPTRPPTLRTTADRHSVIGQLASYRHLHRHWNEWSDRLVRASGLSRAEFASRIGISASRLSTYVTGKVTPSAALLLRIRCTAESFN